MKLIHKISLLAVLMLCSVVMTAQSKSKKGEEENVKIVKTVDDEGNVTIIKTIETTGKKKRKKKKKKKKKKGKKGQEKEITVEVTVDENGQEVVKIMGVEEEPIEINVEVDDMEGKEKVRVMVIDTEKEMGSGEEIEVEIEQIVEEGEVIEIEEIEEIIDENGQKKMVITKKVIKKKEGDNR